MNASGARRQNSKKNNKGGFGRLSPSMLAIPAATVAALSSVGLQPSQAALTWDSATGPTNNWSTAAGNENWDPGNVVWTQNSDAVFNTGAETVTVTTNNSFNNITFGVSGFVIANGAGNLDIDSTDNASSITVTNALESATINEVIRNNGGGATPGSLTKDGAGTLTLSNANTFTGGLTISAGTVTSTANAGFGAGTVAIGPSGTATITLGRQRQRDKRLQR